MSLCEYSGFALAGFLSLALFVTVVRQRRFRVMMMGRLKAVQAALAEAHRELLGLRK